MVEVGGVGRVRKRRLRMSPASTASQAPCQQKLGDVLLWASVVVEVVVVGGVARVVGSSLLMSRILVSKLGDVLLWVVGVI